MWVAWVWKFSLKGHGFDFLYVWIRTFFYIPMDVKKCISFVWKIVLWFGCFALLSHSLTLILSDILSYTLIHFHILLYTFTHSEILYTVSCSLTLSHTVSHSLTLSHIHSYTFTHSQTFSYTLTFTHSQALTVCLACIHETVGVYSSWWCCRPLEETCSCVCVVTFTRKAIKNHCFQWLWCWLGALHLRSPRHKYTSIILCCIECCCSDESCKHQLMKSDQFYGKSNCRKSAVMVSRTAGTTSNQFCAMFCRATKAMLLHTCDREMLIFERRDCTNLWPNFSSRRIF